MPTIVVLGDDLIWTTRLAAIVRAAGGEATVVRSIEGLTRSLAELPEGQRFAAVDLTARAYESIPAIGAARAAGAAVLAIGQHDLVDQRRAAREAGASRVVAYRQLSDGGESILHAWLASGPAEARTP